MDSDLTLTSTTLLSKQGKESISSAASLPKNGDQCWKHRSLYITYIIMALEYASAGWSSWISQSSLRSLQTVQNAGLRSVGNLYKTCPQDFLHLETGWNHSNTATNKMMTSLGIGMQDFQMKIDENNSFSRMLP